MKETAEFYLEHNLQTIMIQYDIYISILSYFS